VSTLRMELHAHQGADGLAALGTPWRIPLPMDLRRLPGGDGIRRRTALRAGSESVGRAYRWTVAGTTAGVELTVTGDREERSVLPLGGAGPMDGDGAEAVRRRDR
jgi:hypothetical protein